METNCNVHMSACVQHYNHIRVLWLIETGRNGYAVNVYLLLIGRQMCSSLRRLRCLRVIINSVPQGEETCPSSTRKRFNSTLWLGMLSVRTSCPIKRTIILIIRKTVKKTKLMNVLMSFQTIGSYHLLGVYNTFEVPYSWGTSLTWNQS